MVYTTIFLQSTKIFTPFRKKKTMETRIIKKTSSIKMEKICNDVKTQKACEQGWEANKGLKIKQTTSI